MHLVLIFLFFGAILSYGVWIAWAKPTSVIAVTVGGMQYLYRWMCFSLGKWDAF